MKIEIRDIREDEIETVRRLLAANGWTDRVADAVRFGLMVERSRHAVVAIADDRVVGFARALSDGVSNGYLSMLVVDSAFRHRGIGRALVAHVTGGDPDMTWVLRAARSDVQPFYERLGFSVSSVAMERVRNTPRGNP